MKNRIGALLVLVAVPCGCGDVPHGTVLAYGVCDPGTEQLRYALPQSPTGDGTIADASIVEQTDIIPLRKGIAFGVKWKAIGLPKVAHFTFHMSYPLITRPDNAKSTSYDESTTYDTKAGEFETVDCYQLREEFELVPGDWTITILYGEATLVTHTFHVTPP